MTLRIAIALCLLCLIADTSVAAEKQFSAGFVALPPTAQTPPMGIWYPSTSAKTAGKLGPFRPIWAWGGDAAGGTFPVVVLSHGHTGRYRNHRQTAAALARNGYVVVAPDHLSDGQMTSKGKIVPVVSVRVEELKHALSVVDAHPLVGKISDATRVGAVGYSLETMTTLYAAGATPEMLRFDRHCESHYQEDSNFCGSGWTRSFFAPIRVALSRLKEKGLLKPKTENRSGNTKEFPPLKSPISFSAIALIAPIGAPFSAEALHRPNANIALFRLGNDEQLRYPYHAEHLYKLLGDKAREYKTFDDVHHYAFISPFPKRLLEEEDIPVAVDPEGFDRTSFIRNINTDIVNFFNEYL